MRDVFEKYGYSLIGKWKQGNSSYQIVRHNECGYEYQVTFNKFKDAGRRCPDCSKSRTEKLCRQYFEEWYAEGDHAPNFKFQNTRPDWLINPDTGYKMELDGYNPKCKCAFEYNGIQHYKYKPEWHKTKNDFLEQQKRDQLKYQICYKRGLRLCIIPYQYNCYRPDQLRTYIRDWLSANDYIEI